MPANPGSFRGKSVLMESAIQQSCVRWFRLQYPWPKYLLFAVPNGGARSFKINLRGRRYSNEALRLKLEGVTPGIPDLVIPHPCGNYHGLFVEMKTPVGRVRPEQRVVLDFLDAQGFKTAICRGLEEFQQTVNQYFALGRRIA